MNKASVCSGIPALKTSNGSWCREPKAKADLLATTFASKFRIPPAEINEYSAISADSSSSYRSMNILRIRIAMKVLEKLDENSATGPDMLAARILKKCARVLAIPFCKLARAILRHGQWPSTWMLHWILALYKKKSVYDPNNYRGIHLTAQISKAMERFIGKISFPMLLQAEIFGSNQFAYTPKRGARDAVLFYILSWIRALNSGLKIAIYCSDVSGAFDRVSMRRLVEKLKASGVNEEMLAVFKSWLGSRFAIVIVSGAQSETMSLENMIYQGTVWGPTLWNIYYRDAAIPLRRHGFLEVVYADDLNCFKFFQRSTFNKIIFTAL